MPEPSFTWLHLTDLHVGMGVAEAEWPGAEDEVLKDLQRCVGLVGSPIDAILFTGDLTQKAGEQEFRDFGGVLSEIREAISKAGGGNPLFVAVPGNHDLDREAADEAAAEVLRDLAARRDEVQKKFWKKPACSYRAAVRSAFTRWSSWSAGNIDWHRFSNVSRENALFPGEFAATWTGNGISVGLMGLNTAAVQLMAGDYEGKLVMSGLQANALVERPHKWCRQHHVNLLLTHHPPTWLNPDGRSAYRNQVAKPDWFDLHLCGHCHEQERVQVIRGGGAELRLAVGRSLFGLEEFGEQGGKKSRLFGFTVGRVVVADTRRARFWPRADQNKQAGTWRIEADHSEEDLLQDQGTPEEDWGPPDGEAGAVVPAATPPPAPTGWKLIDSEFLAGQQQVLSSDELRRYYDGQEPDWRHALAGHTQIPRRDVVGTVASKFESPTGQTMVLLLTAGGEGKSTILRQVAVDLARSGTNVLVRDRTAETPLDTGEVLGLPEGQQWLLVSDDADQIASDLGGCVRAVKDAGRDDIHWLLGARDTDWTARWRRRRRDTEPEWTRYAEVWPRRRDRGTALRMTASDAQAIVTAWDAAGALGPLEAVAEEDRAQELLRSSRTSTGLGNETLFGAVLDKRIGADGLPGHVLTLLQRLSDEFHELDGGYTLLDAFLLAAVCDAVGIDGIDLRVVGDLVQVARDRLRPDIRIPLGAEAAAVGGSQALRTRHPAIAAESLRLVEDGRVPEDLAEIYRSVVRGTASAAKEGLRLHLTHGAIMNIGPTLLKELPKLGVATGRAKEIALGAAEEAEGADPELLVLTVTRAKTLRDAGEPNAAADVLRAALGDAPSRRDFDRVGRGYLNELAAAFGKMGRFHEDIALLGLEVSDQLGAGGITRHNARSAVGGIGGKLLEIGRARCPPYAAGLLRACELLYPQVLGKETHKWASSYGNLAGKLGASAISLDEAYSTLAHEIDQARRACSDEQVRALFDTVAGQDQLSFRQLKRAVARWNA